MRRVSIHPLSTPTRWTGVLCIRVLSGDLDSRDLRLALAEAGCVVIAGTGLELFALDVLRVQTDDAVFETLSRLSVRMTGERGGVASEPLPGLTEATASLCDAASGRGPETDSFRFADIMSRGMLEDLVTRELRVIKRESAAS